MRLLIISIKTTVTAYPFKLFSPRSGPYPFRYIMAKHYKKYNADNKNKSQNIIKKTFMPPRDYATTSRFSKLYVYRKSTTIKSHRHRHHCAPIRKFYCASAIHDAHGVADTHHAHTTTDKNSPTPTTTNTTTPYSPKIRPPPHTPRQKKHQNTRRTPKTHKKMADFRHFFNNKTPITPTFAPCFWLFLRDYLQFLKISSNVHRPVLRYFLYLFPVHFHYSGRPLSVLFLNNN